MLPDMFHEGPAGRLLRACCDVCAVVGGVILVAMAAMTVTSVVGRAFFARPILGDVELVQLGTAVCVALFLPYTQMRGGNIIVDIFTARAAPRAKAVMDGFGALLYTLMMALLSWRLFAGGLSALESQEVSVLMNFPLWVAYMLMVPGLALAAAIGLYHAAWHWFARGDETAA
jgi:TRAP-type C4-dicarboxylate transport system permease small subunit